MLRRLLILSTPLLGLVLLLPGCTTSGTSSGARAPSTPPRADGVDPAPEEARSEALLALERAETARRAVAGGDTVNAEMVTRGDTAFGNADTARFNSRFRAARELYLQAAEFYELAVDVKRPDGGGEQADPVAPSAEIEIPSMQAVAGASEQTVEALFADVDRVQRLAYTGGALQSAGDLVKQADTELWDAQIAYQRNEFPVAAGHLQRIHAMYSEAYRRARATGGAAPGGNRRQEEGPIRWADSLGVARRQARESGKPVLLLLYERASVEVVSLFTDPEVLERARGVVPCKHRVTDILSGVDPAFLSESDREVRELIDSFALRSFPALVMLSAQGEYLDFRPTIAGRTTILDLLEDIE